MEINSIEYVHYNEADLRFTGWEHECIIIDRSSNQYLIPKNRFEELQVINIKSENKDNNFLSGSSGISGVVGYNKS